MVGSRRFRFGDAMSILARSTRDPSGNSPARIRAKRSRFSAIDRSRYGLTSPGLGQRAAELADLVGAQVVDVGLARLDQLHRPAVELLEVVGGVVEVRAPVEAEPAHVGHDRVDVLHLFLGRVGVVEPEMAGAPVLRGEAEVEADRLGVADVQVAVRLRREPRDDPAAEAPAGVVLGDDLADEVGGRSRFGGHGVVVDDTYWNRTRQGFVPGAREQTHAAKHSLSLRGEGRGEGGRARLSASKPTRRGRRPQLKAAAALEPTGGAPAAASPRAAAGSSAGPPASSRPGTPSRTGSTSGTPGSSTSTATAAPTGRDRAGRTREGADSTTTGGA